MTRPGSWLLDRASRVLEPAEREVLLGDAAEAHASVGRALGDILGLAARRQLMAWGEWQPWLALLFVVVPSGVLLSLVSRFWADDIAATIQLYATQWEPLFRNPGGRGYLIERTGQALLHGAALTCWSWTCGAAIVSLSRRTAPVNGVLFVVVLLLAAVGTTTTVRHNPFGAALFDPITQMLSFLIRIAVVVVPATFALRYERASMPLTRTALWTAAATVLTLLTLPGIEASLFFGWLQSPGNGLAVLPVLRGQWLPGPDGIVVSADDILHWPLRWLPLLTLWPVTLLIVLATLRNVTTRWRAQRG